MLLLPAENGGIDRVKYGIKMNCRIVSEDTKEEEAAEDNVEEQSIERAGAVGTVNVYAIEIESDESDSTDSSNDSEDDEQLITESWSTDLHVCPVPERQDRDNSDSSSDSNEELVEDYVDKRPKVTKRKR